MIGIVSPSAGALILPSTGPNENIVLDLIDGNKQDFSKAQYMYSAAQDWVEIEGKSADDLLKSATEKYWLSRAVSLVRTVLKGLDRPLAERVFQEVEGIIGTHLFTTNKVLSFLLVAPLRDTCDLNTPAKLALSIGCPVTASLIDELGGMQPLLRRFTDKWLKLPESVFCPFMEPRESVWLSVIENCEISQILKAANKANFTSQWNLLSFCFDSPQARSGINVLARELSKLLFPQEFQEHQISENIDVRDESGTSFVKKQNLSDYEYFRQAQKQINAITEAVSQGNDSSANKFLRELVDQQSATPDGVKFVVKSLCNIANQCANMFRLDFEHICLEKALDISSSSDAWTFIQYGDHWKRLGKYDLALEAINKARILGVERVATSSEADIYSQQGNYDKAIQTYQSIIDWNDDPKLLTAIADNHRRKGELDLAEEEYGRLLDQSQQGLFGVIEAEEREARAHSGIAEISKRKGDLEKASKIYYDIIGQNNIDINHMLIYKMSLCNVLKSSGRYEAAFPLVDDVIRKSPFLLEARFLRGSLFGLIGKEDKGLKDLPEKGIPPSWRAWLPHYYRGLLLFKLDRYADAKKELVEEFPKAIASGEEKTVLRMAAALCYLKEEDVISAEENLKGLPELYDSHSHCLNLILKFHCATLKEDLARIESLKIEISELQIYDQSLQGAFTALLNRDYNLAFALEADAFLKAA